MRPNRDHPTILPLLRLSLLPSSLLSLFCDPSKDTLYLWKPCDLSPQPERQVNMLNNGSCHQRQKCQWRQILVPPCSLLQHCHSSPPCRPSNGSPYTGEDNTAVTCTDVKVRLRKRHSAEGNDPAPPSAERGGNPKTAIDQAGSWPLSVSLNFLFHNLREQSRTAQGTDVKAVPTSQGRGNCYPDICHF